MSHVSVTGFLDKRACARGGLVPDRLLFGPDPRNEFMKLTQSIDLAMQIVNQSDFFCV